MKVSVTFLLIFCAQLIFAENRGVANVTKFVNRNVSFADILRPKRQSCRGHGTLTQFQFCDTKSKKVTLRHTFHLIEIKLFIIPACSGQPTIVWSFQKVGNFKPYNTDLYKNKAVFVIAPSDNLLDGMYMLRVTVQEKGKPAAHNYCRIELMSEPPVPVFVNGRVHTVRSGLGYTVDITKTVSKLPLTRKDVIWSNIVCERSSKTQCSTVACPSKPTDLTHVILPSVCFKSLEFKVSMKFHEISVFAKQTVFFIPLLKPMVEFRCRRNCDMEQNKLTNPLQETQVCIVCLQTCAFFNKNPHLCELINVESSKVLPASLYTLEKNVEIKISKKSFQYDSNYKLTCKTSTAAFGQDYAPIMYFKTSPKIKPPRCSLSPTTGRSMFTAFKVTCEPTELYGIYYPPDYNVYQHLPDGSKVVVVTSTYKVFDFAIGSSGQPFETLSITGHDPFYNRYTLPLPNIKLTKSGDRESVYLLLAYVDDLSKKGDYSRAVQIVRGFLLETKGVKNIQTDRVYKNMIISLNKILIESVYSYNRIASVLDTFYEDVKPVYKTQLSELCKKLSETQLSTLKKSLFTVQMDDEAKSMMKPMRRCANKLLESEEDEEDEINVTEPPELVPDPAVREDYPNYDQAFHNKEEEYVKGNAMDTIRNSAKATALTINPGDEVEEKFNRTQTKVAKEFGRDIHKKEISVTGVDVTMTLADKNLNDKKLTAIVTTYNKGLFKTNLDTKVVDVGIYNMQNSTKKTAKVKVHIKFDLENPPIEKDEYTVYASTNLSGWKDPDIQYTMDVHRLNLPKQHVCSVEFKKLEAGKKLQMVFIHNRRPRYSDFQKKSVYVLDSIQNTSIIACPFKQFLYDTYVYIAILPHKDILTNVTSPNISVVYQVAFASQFCLTYEDTSKTWITSDCYTTFLPDNNSSKIMCSCNHTSLFSAINKKIFSKLDPVKKIEYETHFQINYVIFIHVAAIFACYCIALIFLIKRVPKTFGRDKIIFLSDNLKNDRYAYLLVIKTGDFSYAGTTANVMIQIFADKANSKPHVLNYPDPDKKLLQKNCIDWFILTNDVYLGDILYIDLWFDGIGYRPTWYCENMYLIDLQNRKEWYFDIQKLFTLKNEVSVEYRIQPTNVLVVSENIMTTIIKHSKFHVGGEVTWNIFEKTNDECFSYAQRLTVILSMIYTTYVLVILFMYPPTATIADAYAYGYFQYTGEVLYIPPITSILSCIINLPFVYFFRNSENESNYFAFYKEKRTFPLIATRITWGVLISWIILCMLYLIVFGFFVSINTTFFWIFATILSILMAIFIVENIYITVLNIIQARVAKFKINRYDFVGMIKEVENQRKILFSVFGEMLLRPYFLEHYKHLTKEKILEMMQVEHKRTEVERLFRDFLLFLIYLGLLYAICFANVNDQDYQSNTAMRLMIRGKFFTPENKVKVKDKVHTVEDIYDYINYTIVPVIHATNWYGNYHSKNAGQMLDFNTKILGVAQLRQQRREQNCQPTYPMNYLNIKCNNESKVFESWEYNNGSENTYTLGTLENYSGAGYISNLGRTMYNSYFMLNLLKRVNWIDINTKVLFIDFWTYNPNYNIFNLVKIIIERSPTGHFIKSETVFTTRLLYSSEVTEIIVVLLIIIFIAVIVINTFKSIISLTMQRKLFFKDIWEIIDLILVILSITVCVLYFRRKKVIKKIMNRLVNSENNEFVNYFELITIAKLNTWISSALLCLATIRLWKFLRFVMVFRAMERTLWKSSAALLMTFLYQIFIYFIFTFYIHMMYGQSYHLFRTYRKTLTTLFLISINFFDNFNHTYISQYGSEIYFLYSFFVICSLVFMTIYSTIIILGLKESQNFYSNKPSYYTLANYWTDQTTYYLEKLKRHNKNTRLRAGQDEETESEIVFPKELAKRYADCISMSNDKMLLMRLVALAVISKRSAMKNFKTRRITKDLFKLMARITVCLAEPHKKRSQNLENIHLFFPGKDPVDNNIRFISNDTLLKMEFVAKYILQPKIPDITFDTNRYVIHVEGDVKRLEYYRDVLELINRTIDSIKIVVNPRDKGKRELRRNIVKEVEEKVDVKKDERVEERKKVQRRVKIKRKVRKKKD